MGVPFQASADLLLEFIIGKTLDEIRQLTKDDLLELLNELGPSQIKGGMVVLESSVPVCMDWVRQVRQPGGR